MWQLFFHSASENSSQMISSSSLFALVFIEREKNRFRLFGIIASHEHKLFKYLTQKRYKSNWIYIVIYDEKIYS